MAMSSTRACSACHAAKVKCVKAEGSSVCKRCERLGLKCVEHVSRQGQGTRRRKKNKTKPGKQNDADAVDEALRITESLTPRCNGMATVSPTPFATKSNLYIPTECVSKTSIPDFNNAERNNAERNNNGSVRGKGEDILCSGMDSLAIEDTVICKSITNGLDKDHFGLNHMIRQWIAIAFSRRSFSLLARASFMAAKLNIPMDEIISNQSPFAAATDSQPMDFLARDLLLAKGERKTLGFPIDLREVPWDVLDSVQIDCNRPEESTLNRCAAIRWTINGCVRFWASPLFEKDFATVDEMSQVWEENSDDKEVVDLFLSQGSKARFAQNIFNSIFVNHKPNMPCFVTKAKYEVKTRKGETFETNVIQTIKLIDLDAKIQYIEIMIPNNEDFVPLPRPTGVNKRGISDDFVRTMNDDPIMGQHGNEFLQDFTMTEEMEELMKMLNGEE